MNIWAVCRNVTLSVIEVAAILVEFAAKSGLMKRTHQAPRIFNRTDEASKPQSGFIQSATQESVVFEGG